MLIQLVEIEFFSTTLSSSSFECSFMAVGCIIGWGRSYAADAVSLLPVHLYSFFLTSEG